MKKIALTVVALALSAPSFAAMQVHEYIAKVSGPEGCEMPVNLAKPAAGECNVELATYKVGKETVRRGTECFEVTRKLVGMNKVFTPSHWKIDAPQLHTQIDSVKCPKSLL